MRSRELNSDYAGNCRLSALQKRQVRLFFFDFFLAGAVSR